MTRNASFVRKIIYISVMAVLLLPLSYLSQPSGADAEKYRGGKLDQLRRSYDLSQSSLGEVDPTSETMKLATLGMRGVATTILWQQANEHKKKENWDAFALVLRQISKLQPHFIKVWIFQSWNQSYNVSVEFDNYRYRYHWVKKGINYLIEGTRYNQRNVRLQGELGRVFGHKIGRSDERRQFRRMFRVDRDFHDDLPINPDDPDVEVRDYEQKIDNWLVAREFHLRAIRIAESPRGGKDLGASPVLFYSEPIMKRMKYAETIIEEGYFGEPARKAWEKSGDEWVEYGNRTIPTSTPGIRIELLGLDRINERIAEIDSELERILAEDVDIREEIRAEKIAALPDDLRQAFELPKDERNLEQNALAAQAEKNIEVSHAEMLERAPEELKKDAARLVVQLDDLMSRKRFIESYRNIVNYDYWGTRCEAEQNQKMLNARKYVYEAAQLYRDGKLTASTNLVTGEQSRGAKEVYEQAFDLFAEMFLQFPVMLDNPETEDLLEHIRDYRDLLGQLDQDMPSDFPLQIVIDMYDTIGQKRQNSEDIVEQWVQRMTSARERGEDESGTGETDQEDDPRTATPRPPVPVDAVEAIDEEQDPRAVTPSPPVVE